jgi:hypothetical protein
MFTRSAPAFSFGLQELPVCRRVARIESGNPLCCESRLPHFHASASLSPCSPDRIRESALLRVTAPAFSCGLQELPVCRRVARIRSGNSLCCGLRLPHFHAGYKCSCGLQELPVCRRVARIGSGNPLCGESRLPHFHAATRSASLSPCSPDRIRESALLRVTSPAFSCGYKSCQSVAV